MKTPGVCAALAKHEEERHTLCTFMDVTGSTMRWGALLLSFHGRIGRRAFWIGMAVAFVFAFVGERAIALIDAHMAPVPGAAFWPLIIIALVPLFAVSAKRLHDLDQSAIWLIAAPCVLVGVALAAGYGARVLGGSGPAISGVVDTTLKAGAAITLAAGALVLGLKRGERRYNAHGGPPLH